MLNKILENKQVCDEYGTEFSYTVERLIIVFLNYSEMKHIFTNYIRLRRQQKSSFKLNNLKNFI